MTPQSSPRISEALAKLSMARVHHASMVLACMLSTCLSVHDGELEVASEIICRMQ
jgi:hypothetical protein